MNITSTTFGLVIATLLPGLAALYGLTFWSPRVRQVFETFLTSDSNIGLFLLVILAALAMGLLLSALRWVVYERDFPWAKHDRLSPDDFQSLTRTDCLPAFKTVVEEHYRYHQFFGGVSIAWPLIVGGWVWRESSSLGILLTIGAIVVGILLELLLYAAAKDARKQYIDRAKGVLKGRGSP